MAEILVVEDDRMLRTSLRHALEARGHLLLEAAGVAHARPHLRTGGLDVAIIDIGLPDGSGLELLDIARDMTAPPAMIVVSGEDDLATTIDAMSRGATDFLLKPLDLHDLDKALAGALEQRMAAQALANATVRLPANIGADAMSPSLVGRSAVMRAVAKRLAQVASSNEPVLVTGESGTGKEVVARTIHRASARAARSFVGVNCAALSSTLLEAELFGTAKGAFTGSVADRPGRFEIAGDGTIFLDEIGELALDLQPKLLRILQERTYERVGDTHSRPFSARLVTATNRDLAVEVEAGRFRADLFYRLDVLTIDLPPLRERIEDIPLLVARLLADIATAGRAVHHIEPVAIDRLTEYSWPGNIRELGNVLRRAVAMSPLGIIRADSLDIGPHGGGTHAAVPVRVVSSSLSSSEPIPTLAQLERQHIEHVLTTCGWHKRRACATLGISRPTLDRKIREYDLRRPGGEADSGADEHDADD